MCNDYVIITFELSCQILVIKNYDVIDTSIIIVVNVTVVSVLMNYAWYHAYVYLLDWVTWCVELRAFTARHRT